MTRANKKIEEMRRVEQLRLALGGNPPGVASSADERGAPDVLVVMPGHRMGIEVTEIHQQPTSRAGHRRIQESERLNTVWYARELAESSGIPIVDVAVHFNESIRISKTDRVALANALVHLVRENVPPMGEQKVLEMWRRNRP